MLVSVSKGKPSLRCTIVHLTNRACHSYVLFSISNVESLFEMSSSFANCWNGETCNPNWIAAASYLEVVGILIGQITVGYLGDM